MFKWIWCIACICYISIKNINKEKYDVVLIGITKQGDFYLYQGDIEKIEEKRMERW